MKIVFVVPRYHTNMTGWVNALKFINHTVKVHAIVKGSTENYSQLYPEIFELSLISKLIIKIFGAGGTNLYRGFPKLFIYFKALKKEKPDLIIIRDVRRWFSTMAAFYSRLLGIKIILYSQDTLYKIYTKTQILQLNLINKLLNSVWITPILGDGKFKINTPSNLFFVPFVGLNDCIKTTFADDKIHILSIGKFVERKNHLLLLNAVLQLKNEGCNIALTIAGEISTDVHKAHYERIREFVNQNNLQRNTTIKINVEHKSIQSLYSNANVFVLAASNEPASVSVLEAISCKLPVICSDDCGTKWYIHHLQTGYIFKNNSLVDLKNGILWYLNSKKNVILNKIEDTAYVISANNYINQLNKAISAKFNLNLLESAKDKAYTI